MLEVILMSEELGTKPKFLFSEASVANLLYAHIKYIFQYWLTCALNTNVTATVTFALGIVVCQYYRIDGTTMLNYKI